jgi:hypothetical protein
LKDSAVEELPAMPASDAIAMSPPAAAGPLFVAVAEWLGSLFSGEQSGALQDGAKARAYEIQEALVVPVLKARSRDEYWEIRDKMFSDPQRAFELADEFRKLADHLGIAKGEPCGRALLDRLDRYPPPFMGPEHRAALQEGFALLYHPLHVPSCVEGEPEWSRAEPGLSEIAKPCDERFRRILASVLLLSLWASALACGLRPQSDDVSESVARNFADVMAGFRGMLHASLASVA